MQNSTYPRRLSHQVFADNRLRFQLLLETRQNPELAALPSPVSIIFLFKSITMLPRREVEALAECLIEMLDRADGEPDLEDNHDQEWIDEREPEDFY